MLKVETISKDTIKPSSQRPLHSSLQLSSLDQTAPQIFTHLLLFYTTSPAPPDELIQLSTRLKSSLSQTLAHFYPLAGRIRLSQSTNTLHVECNDEGVRFVEARAEADLALFLKDDPIGQFTDLLPIKVTEFRWVEDPLLAVQLTVFAGNGFAIGISVSHLIADGASISSFLSCWSNIARRGIHPNGSTVPCQFDSASVFPPQSSLSNRRLPERSKVTGSASGVAIGRFLIAPRTMERIKGRSMACNPMQKPPTRVEAVSALVWRCLNRTRGKAGSLSHVVNIRNKLSPPLSARTIGNLLVTVVAPAEGSDVSQKDAELAIRNSVRKVDREYVSRREMDRWESEGEGEDCWIFSSWCRMDWYRNDFGWGEPIWFGCGIRDMKDVCILIDAKDGDGMEVWLWLEREEMEKVRRDQEFCKFCVPK